MKKKKKEAFKLLLENVCIQSLTVTRGTEDEGVGILLQLRDETGVPDSFNCYVPYIAPGAVDTELDEQLKELMECFQAGTYMDVFQDVSGEEIDGGLRFVLHGAGWLFDLYGPFWQRIN